MVEVSWQVVAVAVVCIVVVTYLVTVRLPWVNPGELEKKDRTAEKHRPRFFSRREDPEYLDQFDDESRYGSFVGNGSFAGNGPVSGSGHNGGHRGNGSDGYRRSPESFPRPYNADDPRGPSQRAPVKPAPRRLPGGPGPRRVNFQEGLEPQPRTGPRSYPPAGLDPQPGGPDEEEQREGPAGDEQEEDPFFSPLD